MSDFRFVQQVRQGTTTEYYANAGQNTTIAGGDSITMSFDAEVTLDEIMITVDSASATLTWELAIIYPQTGMSNFIYSDSGDFTLNGGSAASGPDVKTWFRLPPNTTLRLSFPSVTSSGLVQLLAIGR